MAKVYDVPANVLISKLAEVLHEYLRLPDQDVDTDQVGKLENIIKRKKETSFLLIFPLFLS